MKLKNYLNETDNLKDTKEFKDALKLLLKKHNLKVNQLDFIGMADNKSFGKHYQWNIIDKKHKSYKSSILQIMK